MHHHTITRAVSERLQPSNKNRKRGKPALLKYDVMVHVCQLGKQYADQNGGYQRKQMISEVIKASGGKLTLQQATNAWTHTIHPLGSVLLICLTHPHLLRLSNFRTCISLQEKTRAAKRIRASIKDQRNKNIPVRRKSTKYTRGPFEATDNEARTRNDTCVRNAGIRNRRFYHERSYRSIEN